MTNRKESGIGGLFTGRSPNRSDIGTTRVISDKVATLIDREQEISWKISTKIMPYALFVAGLFATQQAWKAAEDEAVIRGRQEFASHVSEAVGKIERRMEIYEQVLVGVDGLLTHDNHISRQEYAKYVAWLGLAEKYPGIQAVRFSPIVYQRDLGKHIVRMQQQGLPGYRVFPAWARPFYAPADYIEPFDKRNDAITGYDMYSDWAVPRMEDYQVGTRKVAMDSARDNGWTTISGKVKLLTEVDIKDIQPGFLMFRAVYESREAVNTIEDRRKHIAGWTSLVFRMGDLMRGILWKQSSNIHITIYDSDTIHDAALMYESSKQPLMTPHSLQDTRQISIGWRVWTIVIRSLPAFEKKLMSEKSELIAVAGGIISFLLLFFALNRVSARVREKENFQAIVHANQELNRSTSELERALSELSAFNDAINENAIVSATDTSGRIVYANDRLCEISGYARNELIGANHNIVRSDVHDSAVFVALWETISAWRVWRGEVCNQAKDGSYYWVDATVAPIKNEKDDILWYLSIRIDITARKAMEDQLRKDGVLLETIFNQANAGICLVDGAGKFLRVNPKMAEITGYSPEELLECNVEEITQKDDVGMSQGFIDHANRGESNETVLEKRYVRKDGSIAHVQVSYSAIRDAEGSPIYFVAYVQDIAEIKARELTAYHQASHDALTGLPNRLLMLDRLEMAISHSKHHNTGCVLMFIDLDRFKQVNDTFWHEVGDGLLQEVATRMKALIRTEDTVARIGWDEFVIILWDISNPDDASMVAQKILSCLQAPFFVAGHTLEIGGSIGMSVFSRDGDDVETLQRNADTAMYVVKKGGRNNYQFYHPSMSMGDKSS